MFPEVLPPGSIPACAGEPPYPGSAEGGTSFRAVGYYGVYPRVCGGTPWASIISGQGPGLSPRVRGNRLTAALVFGLTGSIPACAGEPW